MLLSDGKKPKFITFLFLYCVLPLMLIHCCYCQYSDVCIICFQAIELLENEVNIYGYVCQQAPK